MSTAQLPPANKLKLADCNASASGTNNWDQLTSRLTTPVGSLSLDSHPL